MLPVLHSRSVATRLMSLAFVVLGIGCSSDPATSVDGGNPGLGEAGTGTAEGGSGICCPIEVTSPVCSPGNRKIGGWASSLESCPRGGYDGYPYVLVGGDSGACPVMREDKCMRPCGMVPDASFTPPSWCQPDAGVVEPDAS